MHNLLARTDQQLATRSGIDMLEQLMAEGIKNGSRKQTLWDGASEKGNDQCQHFFAEGVYARLLKIPAGTCVIGKLHKQSRLCIILEGKCSYADEFSNHTVEAPFIAEFRGGTKTAVYAHTDTVWVACLGTDLKDPIEIVEKCSALNHADYQKYIEDLK